MSGLRSSSDRVVVDGAALTRARHALLASWRDQHARAFDKDVLTPLERDAARLERAVAAADREVDAALHVLRNLGARL